ncbi:hypothetical protein SC499_24695 [Peribacillus simplex]|nr:hypothetical protein [Peribacillus simplex]MDW7617783.1 hypothetical protein [Peribacillus simplex]
MKHSEYLISNHTYQYLKDNFVKLANNKNNNSTESKDKDKDLQEKNEIRK